MARKDHSASHDDENELMSDREHEERTGGGGGGGRVGPTGVSEEAESEEGVDSQAEDDHIQRKEANNRMEVRCNHEDHFRSVSSSKHNHHYHYRHQKSRSAPFVGPGSGGGQRYAATAAAGGGMMVLPSPSSYCHHHHEGRSNVGSGRQNNRAVVRPWDEELDADGELDAEGDYLNDDRLPPPPSPRSMNRRRPWSIGLADLDSTSGR
jgi:hypothetical protein